LCAQALGRGASECARGADDKHVHQATLL
jgi:hypothetical protein